MFFEMLEYNQNAAASQSILMWPEFINLLQARADKPGETKDHMMMKKRAISSDAISTPREVWIGFSKPVGEEGQGTGTDSICVNRWSCVQ